MRLKKQIEYQEPRSKPHNPRTLVLFILLVLGPWNLVLGSSKIDSLQILLKTTIHDTTRIIALNTLGGELMYHDPDTSILLSTEALAIAEKNRAEKDLSAFRRGISNSNNNLGVYHYLKGDYPKALGFYLTALEIDEGLKNKKGMAIRLGNIGIVYHEQGDYPKALEYYFKALKIDEELGKSSDEAIAKSGKNGIAADLGNIGIVYSEEGDYPRALEYYFKALKINEELGNENGIAICLGNIGNVYLKQGDSATAASSEGRSLAMADTYPRALEYYFKALKKAEELGNKNGLASHLGNIGIVYSEQGDYPKALEYYFKSLKIDKELGNKNGITIRLGNIGSLYTTTGKFKEAERYLLQALELSDSIGALSWQKDHHQHLSSLYDTTGRIAYAAGNRAASATRYQLALEHYQAYSAAKDSLFNEEKSKDLGKLEAKHEFETAEIERKRLEEEQAKREAAVKSRRDNLQYSGILIFLVLVFAGVFALGRFSIPIRLAEGLIFFSFLLFFEFTLVLLDPYIEQYSSGGPAIKLGFNALLAGMIFPLHAFFETKLKSRLAKNE